MVRTNELLLDIDLFKENIVSELGLNAEDSTATLFSINSKIEHIAKKISHNFTTASGKFMVVSSISGYNELSDLVDTITENKTNVYYAKESSSFYAYGCPLLDYIKLVSMKLKMDNSSSKYQRDKLESQINSMAGLPLLVSLIPSEVILIDKQKLYVASASSITGVLSFYKGVNLVGHEVEDGLFDLLLLNSISNGLNVSSEEGNQLVQALKDSPEDVDLTTLFFPDVVKWIEVSPQEYYSIDFDINQRIELLKVKDIGLTLATLCHRILSSNDFYDRKSHLNKISDYLEAYHNLLGQASKQEWLGEQLDVNIGYTAANALVPISSQIASFASFVNSFEELITFGHTIKIVSTVESISELKWVNYLQQPINLVNEIIADTVTINDENDNVIKITSKLNLFEPVLITSDRKTTMSALTEMYGRNEGFIPHYYSQLMGLVDLVISVAAGGKVEIDLSQGSYSVKSSPYIIKRLLYPWIYTKSAKIKRK